MPENKKRLNIAISMELYTKVTEKYGITEAIVEGLKLFLEPPKEQYEATIKDLQNLNESLEKELENQPNLQLQNIWVQDLQEQLKVKDQQQEARISDLKEQIQTLNEQINKKDKLLEELNQTLLAQASNIYNLTQNPKLLPEPKRWWEFWKN